MADKEAKVQIPGHSKKIDLPHSFEPEDVSRAQKDCEILGEILRDRPEEVRALSNDLLQGNTRDAKQRARELGLSEDEFTSKGGGIYALIILVVLLYATDAY
jgi:hypothetical protein